MPETLKSGDESRLLRAVKRAVDLVDDKGLTPDAAIEKIAREEKFGPGMIGVVARAYNTGRQLGQWTANTSIMDKLASFPLADPEKVIRAMYPAAADTPQETALKTGFDREYLAPPSWLPDRERLERSRRDLTSTVKEAAEKCPFCRKSPCICPSKQGEHDPAQRVKAATAMAAPEVDQKHLLKKAYGSYERARNTHEELRRRANQLEDHLHKQVADLTTYFKQASYNRLPFEQVEFAARRYQGPAAVDLLKLAYDRARLRERRALSDAEVNTAPKLSTAYKQAYDGRQEPYYTIATAIETARKLIELRGQVKQAEDEVNRVVGATLRPFAVASPRGQSPPTPLSLSGVVEKRALGLMADIGAIAAGDILGGTYLHHAGLEGKKSAPSEPSYEETLGDDRAAALQAIKEQEAEVATHKHHHHKVGSLIKDAGGLMLGALSGSMARGLGSMPKSKEDLINDQWLELEDPKHMNELRKIRTNAMLTSLLTDSEDPISGHDPDKVLAAYNEIAQMTPRVADNPAALKPVLRKKLSGHTEPFEAKELLDMEKGLRDVKNVPPSTSKLVEAPESIQG